MSSRRGGSNGRPSYDNSWRERSPAEGSSHRGQRDRPQYERRGDDRRSYDGHHNQRGSSDGSHNSRSSYGGPPHGNRHDTPNSNWRQSETPQAWNNRSDQRFGPSRGDGWRDRPSPRDQGWQGNEDRRYSGARDGDEGRGRSSYGTPQGEWSRERRHYDRSSDNRPDRDAFSAGATGRQGHHRGKPWDSARGGRDDPHNNRTKQGITKYSGRYTDVDQNKQNGGGVSAHKKFETGNFWQHFTTNDLSGCIVHYLAPKVDESILFELFHQAGPVVSVKIQHRRGDRKGYVFFADKESAQYAAAIFTNVSLFGQRIHVLAPKLYVDPGNNPDTRQFQHQQAVSKPPPSFAEVQRERERIMQAGSLMPHPPFIPSTPQRALMPHHFAPPPNMFTPPGPPLLSSSPALMAPLRFVGHPGMMRGMPPRFQPMTGMPMGFGPMIDFSGNHRFAGPPPSGWMPDGPIFRSLDGF